MRLIISFAALFLSVLLLQLSSGGLGPLDALSGLKLEFSTQQIGLLGSSHFLGFFIGCWWAPRLMGSVGHSRAFAAFTATGAIGLLAHMLVVNPYAWAVMRIASGLCVAGCYTFIEAWLQAKVTNETRGRAMGTYRVVDMSGSLVAQLMIGVLAPSSYVSYNILAILSCAALLPLTLTKVPQPETPKAPRLRPLLAYERSPPCRRRCGCRSPFCRILPHGWPALWTRSRVKHRPNHVVLVGFCFRWCIGTVPCRMAGGQIRPALSFYLAVCRSDPKLWCNSNVDRIWSNCHHGDGVPVWPDIIPNLFNCSRPCP